MGEQWSCEGTLYQFSLNGWLPGFLAPGWPLPYLFSPFSGSFSSLQTLNKNNLIPDDRASFYPLQQTNVYTTTYYPSPLNKPSFRPEASPGQRCFPNS